MNIVGCLVLRRLIFCSYKNSRGFKIYNTIFRQSLLRKALTSIYISLKEYDVNKGLLIG